MRDEVFLDSILDVYFESDTLGWNIFGTIVDGYESDGIDNHQEMILDLIQLETMYDDEFPKSHFLLLYTVQLLFVYLFNKMQLDQTWGIFFITLSYIY